MGQLLNIPNADYSQNGFKPPLEEVYKGLILEALDEVEFKPTNSTIITLQYSNDGFIWNNVSTSEVTHLEPGQRMAFRAYVRSTSRFQDPTNCTKFNFSKGHVKASGDMSYYAPSVQGAYMWLFSNKSYANYGVEDASELVIPVGSTARDCCSYMFCRTPLKQAPQLPSLQIPGGVYSYMFSDCRLLPAAPDLPATTFLSGSNDAYTAMFEKCSTLRSVTIRCTGSRAFTIWLSGVASSGTIYKYDTLTLPQSSSGIPAGWTVVSLD